MSTAPVKSLTEVYESMMYEIIMRTELIIAAISPTDRVTGFLKSDYEVASLNFRKIAELIVYANLVGHEKEYAALHPNYSFEWRLAPIIKKIKAINPDYYPKATTQGVNEKGQKTANDVPAGIWMTEDELIEMYDSCADLLHEKNPFQPQPDLSGYTNRFPVWLDKIIQLLNHHIVLLPDGVNSIWCIMNPENTFKPKAYMFTTILPTGK